MTFTKANLYPGDIVKLRNEDFLLITQNHGVNEKICIPLNLYTSDLYIISITPYNKQYDIIEAYRISDLSAAVIHDAISSETSIPSDYRNWFKVVQEYITNYHSDPIIRCLYDRNKIIIDIF